MNILSSIATSMKPIGRTSTKSRTQQREIQQHISRKWNRVHHQLDPSNGNIVLGMYAEEEYNAVYISMIEWLRRHEEAVDDPEASETQIPSGALKLA